MNELRGGKPEAETLFYSTTISFASQCTVYFILHNNFVKLEQQTLHYMKSLSVVTPTEKVDLINILCMIVSAVLAYFLPFALFLFSYAVFGPLHYLTEISWLHNKRYFISVKYGLLFFLVICSLLFLFSFYDTSLVMDISTSLMFFAFFSAFVMVAVNNNRLRYILMGIIFLCSLLIKHNQLSFAIFAILLPTIIHVFVFTACFILFGALKSKSRFGILSLVVFALCFVSLFLVTVNINTFTVNDYIKSAYDSFASVNLQIMSLVNIHNPDIQKAIYESPAGLSIMRFIAFAYTYHYLNWFSKTKIIHWDDISKQRLTAIIVLWIASVVLYIVNYKTGLFALYFLSLLHVLLEFPLNHRSIIGIYEEFRKKVPAIRLSPAK